MVEESESSLLKRDGGQERPAVADMDVDELVEEDRLDHMVALDDVSNSVAMKGLEILVHEGSVTEEKAAFIRGKYEALHRALLATMKSDRELLDQAKNLNKKLQADKEGMERAQMRVAEGSAVVDILREDSEQAESEAVLCKEKEQMLLLEAGELTKLRDEYKRRFDEIEKEHMAALAPVIRQTTEDIEEFDMRIKENAIKLSQMTKELEDVKSKMEKNRVDISLLRVAQDEEANALEKKGIMPEKYRKQADAVVHMIQQYKIQEIKLFDKIKECEQDHSKLWNRARELTEEHVRASSHLERVRLQAVQKVRGADEIKKNVEIAGIEADQLLADQVNLDMLVKNLTMELKRESEELAHRVKDKDNVLRKFKKADISYKQMYETIPVLNIMKEQTLHKIQIVDSERKRQGEILAELKRDVDINMHNFLNQEEVGKEKIAALRETMGRVEELEREVGALSMQEKMTCRHIVELGSQRERIARFCSSKVTLYREAMEKTRVKDLIIIDLKKKLRDGNQRFKDFMQLYDLVKNQRNKFVTLIQASSQSVAEMREKLRILTAEIDILRNETSYKDRLLAKARAEHASSIFERDHLRTELAKASIKFQEKQKAVDEQINRMDQMTGIINGIEREMLHLKKKYEAQVESRNYTGITLIDRNDELCILYERLNIIIEVYKHSELEIFKREDEIKVLKSDIGELERSISVTRKIVPQVPELQRQVESLKKEVLNEREEVVRLSELLENPVNKERWRQLEGKTPKMDELVTILESVEEKLSDRKEQQLERELVYQEVSKLSDQLRRQAGERREETMELAIKANAYRKKIADTVRKIMAAVAELSLCQATAIRLAEERDDLIAEVLEASKRLERGEPPTQDACREWYRIERERQMIVELADRRTALEREDEGPVLEGGMRNKPPRFTMAEQRPNAYLPDELAVPRPFGRYAPFKPSDEGPILRHVRRPQPRPVEI